MAIDFDHPTSDPTPGMQLQIPPNPLLGKMVRNEILAYARDHAVESRLGDFMFAVGEALANAFSHASMSETIKIRCWLSEQKLFVVITDRGPGIRAAPKVDFPDPETLTERGRGMPIMRHCADLFSVDTLPRRGTKIVLMRDLSLSSS